MRRGHAVAGFSLIEFAILLVIFGAIAAASTMLGGKWVEKEEHKSSKLNTKTVEESLDAYRKLNGRLPCPADPTLAPDDANFGVEAANAGTCTGGAPAAGTAAGGAGNTVIGVVPTKTLGMGNNLVVDAWGNRFDYYVDKRMTADNAFTVYNPSNTDIGDIEVRDPSGGVRTAKAVYALVSKGGNARGAAARDGTMKNTATADLLEQENNEYNAAGTASARDNILVQAAPTDQFDDIVSFKTRAQMSTGTKVIRPANCLASSVNWTVGADSCSGSVAELVDGATATITDSAPLGVGQVTVSCDNGTLTQSSATCEAGAPCTAGTENWTVSGKACSAAVGVLVHGASTTITDSTSPRTGGATITCTNGVKSQSATTCYNECAATAQNWDNGAGSSCTATPAVLAHNASASITDSTAPATGNVTVTCNDGSLAQSGPTCSGANTCAATTLNWTVGANSCSAAVGSVAHGANSVITDATVGLSPAGSGSATATCTNGSFALSATTCNAQCAASTANWTVATAPCSAAHGVLNHGSSTGVTDSTANSTGSVTLSCTNGVVSQSGASCTTTCVAGAENWTQGANSCTGARGAIAGGASAVVSDVTAPATGTVTATCNTATGLISQSGATCTTAVGCAAGTASWAVGANCDAPIGALAHGASAALSDSTTAPTLTSGAATATCNNGTLVYSGTSCTPGCAAQTVNWGAGCTANIAASLHTNSGTLTNTAAGYTGTVTATCTNGTLSQSGATCTSTGSACAANISVGGASACALDSTGKSYCWGANNSGEIGDNTYTQRQAPTLTLNGAGSGTYKQISTQGTILPDSLFGTLATCALGTNDRAYCWGTEWFSGLSSPTPTLMPNGASPGTYKQISVGNMHFCALGTDDKAYCWGYNGQGQLGDGTSTNRTSPVLVLNGAGPGTYKQIASGQEHTCAIGTNNRAYCWGYNGRGQLGDGTTANRSSPVLVLNGAGPGTYKQISSGQRHTCGVGTDDKAYCWGGSGTGNLGDGTTADRSSPVLVLNGAGPGTYKQITAGFAHSCGLGTDNKAYCWGYNYAGELGDGTTTQRNSPVLVLNGASSGTYKQISAGGYSVCAVGTNDRAYCWGLNSDGQLGDSTTTQRLTPVAVVSGAGLGNVMGPSCP